MIDVPSKLASLQQLITNWSQRGRVWYHKTQTQYFADKKPFYIKNGAVKRLLARIVGR